VPACVECGGVDSLRPSYHDNFRQTVLGALAECNRLGRLAARGSTSSCDDGDQGNRAELSVWSPGRPSRGPCLQLLLPRCDRAGRRSPTGTDGLRGHARRSARWETRIAAACWGAPSAPRISSAVHRNDPTPRSNTDALPLRHAVLPHHPDGSSPLPVPARVAGDLRAKASPRSGESAPCSGQLPRGAGREDACVRVPRAVRRLPGTRFRPHGRKTCSRPIRRAHTTDGRRGVIEPRGPSRTGRLRAGAVWADAGASGWSGFHRSCGSSDAAGGRVARARTAGKVTPPNCSRRCGAHADRLFEEATVLRGRQLMTTAPAAAPSRGDRPTLRRSP